MTATALVNPDCDSLALADLVKIAWNARTAFDLKGIGYGRLHHPLWLNKIIDEPFDYYFFLAGFVRTIGAERIVEVGTHWGGSARAMREGFAAPDKSKIVTFDITKDGAQKLKDCANVKAYSIDANTEKAVQIVLDEFGRKPIDMIYVDTAHKFWPTIQSFSLYSAIFRPRYAILDDITLNDSMKQCWTAITHLYGPERAVDCTKIVPQIRQSKTSPGFGLVRLGA
jgi:cephalosporin hydroxylase